MTFITRIRVFAFALAVTTLASSALADDQTPPTPDQLTTCPVSGEKLGGDMGKPYVFTYKGQEVKLCCPNCKADFDKNPDQYMLKIRGADKK